MERVLDILGVVLGLIFCSFFCVSVFVTVYNNSFGISEKRETAISMISSGSPCYLDGLEVDGTKLNVANYNIEIREDCVILSN